jgi:signal transduction histidine kinase
MELTGDHDIYNTVLLKKKKKVHAISHQTASLFWEIASISSLQQQTSRKLQTTNAKYNLFLNELIHENVMIIAPDYRIMEINDTLSKQLSIERNKVIGQYCYEIAHLLNSPCSEEEIPCPLEQTLKTKRPSQVTHVHQDQNKNMNQYITSCNPVFENAELVSVINIMKDITKEINLQKVMMQQEKLASIGRLSAGVAHEINNPLTTVLTSVMLILEEMDPDDPIYEELQIITNETLRCRKIVSGLLDFARQKKPVKKMNDLNDIVLASLSLTKKQAEFDDVSIEAELSENLPLINVDKDQLQQALINLTLNAIEATSSAGTVTYSTKFVSETQIIEITISDTGSGIPYENVDRIFDPFFTTKENGTGLGLAVTHGIIEQHGGTIDVNSKPGHGTCFTVRLPLDQGTEDDH